MKSRPACRFRRWSDGACGSSRRAKEWKGLSPFNAEKTPSFFVNDQKQAWFDFSSGKNGNIFDFVIESEGVSFPEAVERLAAEAGVPLPGPFSRCRAPGEEARRSRRSRGDGVRLFRDGSQGTARAHRPRIPRPASAHRGGARRVPCRLRDLGTSRASRPPSRARASMSRPWSRPGFWFPAPIFRWLMIASATA